jgi:EPS I polysaccharide export inner membrane protein EpsE
MRSRLISVFGSAVVQRLSVLLMTICAARLIGAAEYGKFAIVYATCTSFSGFIGDGLAATANRYAAVQGEGDDGPAFLAGATIASFALCVALLVGLLTAALAPLFNAMLGHGMALTPFIRLAGLISVFLLFNTVLSALLNTYRHNVAAAWVALLGAVLSAALALLGALRAGAYGMCLGYALGSALSALLAFVLLQRRVALPLLRPRYIGQFLRSGKMQEFTLPTIATMALGGPVHWLCLSFLAASPAGLQRVAVFTVLFQWYSILTFVPSAMMNFTIPFLARARALGAQAFRRAAASVVLATLGLSALLLAALCLLRAPVLALYGPDFAGEGRLLILLGVCGLLASLITVMNHVAWAAGRSWSNLGSATVYALAYVGAALVCIRFLDMGVLGLASAILLASVLQGAIQSRFFVVH